METIPLSSPGLMWKLQVELMKEAESLFGARNHDKIIYRPDWDEDGPHIRYTPNKDGAFAELSFTAKNSWRLAVFQLAHECVHLLDQHGGERTHNLEEGAAVRFSLDMMTKYGFDNSGVINLDSYKRSLSLFNQLGPNPYVIAKRCRAKCENFISIDEETLTQECPQLGSVVIQELLQRPVMR